MPLILTRTGELLRVHSLKVMYSFCVIAALSVLMLYPDANQGDLSLQAGRDVKVSHLFIERPQDGLTSPIYYKTKIRHNKKHAR